MKNTEQERPWWRDRADEIELQVGAGKMSAANCYTQMLQLLDAERRAPVGAVPQGWRIVPEVLTPEMKRDFMDLLMDGIDIYMNSNDQIEIQTDAPRRIWKFLLAAAPQPPEVDIVIPTSKQDQSLAAPVQMPEPAIPGSNGVCCGNFAEGGYYMGQSEQVCCGCPDDAHPPYYTEQQVRDLLAAQARKTLSDEDALQIFSEWMDGPGEHLELVRAIERAHGIKE